MVYRNQGGRRHTEHTKKVHEGTLIEKAEGTVVAHRYRWKHTRLRYTEYRHVWAGMHNKKAGEIGINGGKHARRRIGSGWW